MQEQNAQSHTHKKNAEEKSKKAAIVVTPKRTQASQLTSSRSTKQQTLTFAPSESKAGSKDVDEEEDAIMSQ